MYRVGELFCGAGGLALAAKLAAEALAVELEHVWAIDNNPWACATYARNIGGQVICADVAEVRFEELPDIDGLLFGFPCNDFSDVGEKLGLRGRFGPLYEYGVRCLEAKHPAWFVAENVAGLIKRDGGRVFALIRDDLRRAGPGYEVTAHLYRFEDYGVPQTRHRVVFVGIRRDMGLKFRPPAPTTAGRPVTAAEALAGVERVVANNERTKESIRVVEMLRHIPPGGNAWHPNVPEHLRIKTNCRLSQIYRRLHPDRPAPTVTARGGGGTGGYHWIEPRALTNRERARLQTFPDWFVFEGPRGEVRAQIGMAVPPRGGQVIIEALLKTLAGIPYETVEPNL